MTNNIYNNNAKEIDPEMVRTVLTSIIESNFNLVDDFLKDYNYSSGVTLEDRMDQSSQILLHSKSGNIPVLSAVEGNFYNGSDGNATFRVDPADGNHDNELAVIVSFSNVGASYIPIVAFEATGSPWYNNNAVIVSFGSANSTSLRVYLQRVYDNPVGKIWVTLLKLP